jgi:hypothetical protein
MQQHNLVFKSEDKVLYPCAPFVIPSLEHRAVGTHSNSTGMVEGVPCRVCGLSGFTEKTTRTCFTCLKKNKVSAHNNGRDGDP